MEIDRIARKLEPLRPREVQEWFRVKDVLQPERRAFLERHILSLAQHELGDFRTKLLLSLPPKGKAKGEFHLGEIIYEKEKWPVGISRSELMQNLAIFGRSGAGKTNVAFHLLEQLINKKVPFLFLDWKRTARHLLPRLKAKVNVFTPGRALSPFAFNPFIVPPGLERAVYIGFVVDAMSSAYTLGEGAKRILQKAITACYGRDGHAPTVEQVLIEVEKMPTKGRAGEWKVSALRALESMAFSHLTSKDNISQQELTTTLLKENTIIELDSLDESGKQFLVPLLCLWLYSVRLTAKEREQLSLVVFVEEAHHVLYRQEQRSKETLMNRLLRQGRELGIGFVVIDQHPHLISSAALGNTYTSICLNQKDPSDINRAAGLSLVPDADKHHLSLLPTGQGVVKLQDRWQRPFLVQFPLVEFKKGLVTDSLLSQILKGELKQKDLQRTLRKEMRQDQKPGKGDRLLTEDEYRFLHDVLQNPDDGVDERYKRLGLSGRKGSELKERLANRGWLSEETEKVGRTHRTRLKVPDEQEKMLGLDFKTIPANLIVHTYWVGYYYTFFQERKYRVELEAPRRGGRVDLLAEKDVEKVFVEIETGKSDYISNIKSCLLSAGKDDRVVVVATNEVAMKKIEKRVGEAGVLIPGKVELVLRDQCDESRLFNNLNSPPPFFGSHLCN